LSDVVIPIGQPSVGGQPTVGATAEGSQPTDGSQQLGQGVAGLKYNLPKPTNGFVRQ
jgi:hypothetical protein